MAEEPIEELISTLRAEPSHSPTVEEALRMGTWVLTRAGLETQNLTLMAELRATAEVWFGLANLLMNRDAEDE